MGRRARIDASQTKQTKSSTSGSREPSAVTALASSGTSGRGLVVAGLAILLWQVAGVPTGWLGASPDEAADESDTPVVVNEVLYDPAGKDAGLEFIELFNRSSATVRLEGWAVETGNGTYADRWTLEWTGGAGDTISARGFFVVGEEAVMPRPDAVADLDLQNGPDACRLLSAAAVVDVVGWGEHVYGEYYEGRPADPPSSGSSLGRDPDGEDSGDNAADFAGLDEPSPGDFNHPPCDLAFVRAGVSRYAGPPAADLDLACLIRNDGAEPCGAGATVRASLGAVEGASPLSGPLGAGGEAKTVVRLPNPGEGLYAARLWLECGCDRRSSNDSISTSVMVPPAPVVISEVMFEPAGTDCEWAEVVNRSALARSLAGWHIADSGGRLRALTDAELTLEPGQRVVLVEDQAAFARSYVDSSGSFPGIVFLRPKGGWPSLNDTDGPLGFADALVLKDAFGTTVDSVAYSEDWSRPGVSVERIDADGASTAASNWSAHCGSAGGSPGAANSVALMVPQSGGMLSLGPASFTPDGDGRDDFVAISVRLARAGPVRVSVFDLGGRLVRRLVDGEVVVAARVTFWDGTSDRGSAAPTGIYVVSLEAGGAPGGGTLRAKAAVVLTRR